MKTKVINRLQKAYGEQFNEVMETVYLSYYNDHLTLHRMTEDYQECNYFGLDELDFGEAYEQLESIINYGRSINHSKQSF